MRWHYGSVGAVLCIVLMFGPWLSVASANPQDLVAERYEAGKAALSEGNAALALQHFKVALAEADDSIGDTWQMLLAVGVAYKQLERPIAVVETFRRFLAVTKPHLAVMNEKWQKRRARAAEHLEELEAAFLATHAFLNVVTNPPGALLKVNGFPAGAEGNATSPWGLILPPGDYVVSGTLADGTTFESSIALKAGAKEAITLEPKAQPTPTAAGPAGSPTDNPVGQSLAASSEVPGNQADSGSTVHPGAWALIGGGAASAIGGIIMSVMADTEAKTAADIEGQGADLGADVDAWRTAQDNHATYNTVAMALYATAGAAAIGGIIWAALDLSKPDTAASLRAVPRLELLPTRRSVSGRLTWSF